MQITGRWWIGCVLAFQILAVEAADYRSYGGFRPLDADEQRLIDSRSLPGYSSDQRQVQPSQRRMPERVLQPYVAPSQPSIPPMGNYRFRELDSANTGNTPQSGTAPYFGMRSYPDSANTGNTHESRTVPYPGMHSYPDSVGSPRWSYQGRQLPPQPVFRPLDGDGSKREATVKRPFSQAMPPGPVYPYALPTPQR